MSDEPGRKGGLIWSLQQWQVVVTVIAAALAIVYGWSDRRLKQLDVNRQAVVAAKASLEREFLPDAHSTLVEFRAVYPEHAFCAALGFYVAEAARRERAAASVREINDAVAAQVQRVGADAGLTLVALEEEARTGIGGAAGGATERDSTWQQCQAVDVRPGFARRVWMYDECVLLLESYAQGRCQVLAAAALEAEVAAQATGEPARMPAAAPSPSPPDAAQTGTAMPGLPQPDEACGRPAPTVYVHYVRPVDRFAAESVRERLVAAGWSVPSAQLVSGGRTSGDVRYYWPEQEACAGSLAQALSDLAEAGTFSTISLAGRYRNLPRGTLEVWLPPAPASPG